MPQKLEALIRRFARQRVLVVGDLMLDQFIWGRVDRVSPEAPVPVVDVTGESFHLGGAGNVAHNIRALGAQAGICGVVGGDTAGARVIEEIRRIDVPIDGVVTVRKGVTIRKTRVIAHSQQVVRFDREQREHDPATIRRLCRYLERHVADFDAVLVSDYGKGSINQQTLAVVAGATRLIVDPKKRNYGFYRGVTLATPNLHEAAEASGVEIADDASLHGAGRALLERWAAEAVLITRGEQGMTLVHRGHKPRHFPAVSRQVFDVTGAGDTVVAVCALALAAGASLEEAAVLANHAAGIVVGKLGTATVSAAELRAALR